MRTEYEQNVRELHNERQLARMFHWRYTGNVKKIREEQAARLFPKAEKVQPYDHEEFFDNGGEYYDR